MASLPLDLLMFAGLCLFVLTGAPIAFVLAGTATVFAILGWSLGELNFRLLGAYPTRVFGLMTSETLVAIPLFVFMGMVLQRARIAEELLETMGALFGRIRGGLAVSVTLVGALLAASTGIVGATTVTMGLMALPVMLRFGYGPSFASGTICSAGTLGQIIPPSTVLIIMGEVLSSAYQQAQHAAGNFAAKTLSVGELFAGSLLPGLVLVGLYIVYQLIIAFLRPDIAPPVRGQTDAVTDVGLGDVMRTLFPPLALMVGVLGSIIGGIATATEAASVGAVGATLLAGRKMTRRRWAIWVAVLCAAAVMVMSANLDLRLGRPDAPPFDRAMLAAFVRGLGIGDVGGPVGEAAGHLRSHLADGDLQLAILDLPVAFDLREGRAAGLFGGEPAEGGGPAHRRAPDREGGHERQQMTGLARRGRGRDAARQHAPQGGVAIEKVMLERACHMRGDGPCQHPLQNEMRRASRL